MRFTTGNIVQHPDLTLIGRVMSCDDLLESYGVMDLSTGKTLVLGDGDELLVSYEDTSPDNPMIFFGRLLIGLIIVSKVNYDNLLSSASMFLLDKNLLLF